MAKKLWKTENESREAIERSFQGIEVLLNRFKGDLGDPAVIDAIGSTLRRNLTTICEGLLYLVFLCFMNSQNNT